MGVEDEEWGVTSVGMGEGADTGTTWICTQKHKKRYWLGISAEMQIRGFWDGKAPRGHDCYAHYGYPFSLSILTNPKQYHHFYDSSSSSLVYHPFSNVTVNG